MTTSHLFPSYNRAPLRFKRGEGVWLIDEEDRRYFDFGAGVGVNAFGHGHERLITALTDQANALWHVSNLYEIPHQEALARALCEISFADLVFFTNSGAEAIEAAIKTARRFHFARGKPRANIIGFHGAFHGRTLATIAAAGSKKLTEGFGPIPEGFIQIEPNEAALTAAIDEEVAAIIVEPIQGEGGIRVMSDEFMRKLRAEADRVGALLIFDEIQCGMGRTGRFFAHEFSGVTPDIMALAKGIGGGFPLGACLARSEVGEAMIAGSHGSTYGGNPLGCRVGFEVVSMMREAEFLPHVNRLGAHASQRLSALVSDHDEIFEELRGEGLMLGLKCRGEAIDFVRAGREEGVLTVPAADNVVRLLPPLNMSLEELDIGIDLLEKTAKAMERG